MCYIMKRQEASPRLWSTTRMAPLKKTQMRNLRMKIQQLPRLTARLRTGHITMISSRMTISRQTANFYFKITWIPQPFSLYSRKKKRLSFCASTSKSRSIAFKKLTKTLAMSTVINIYTECSKHWTCSRLINEKPCSIRLKRPKMMKGRCSRTTCLHYLNAVTTKKLLQKSK